MSRRSGPRIDGYDFVEELERGGSSQVYLYRQHRPARVVAIKVIDAQHSPSRAEADVMAALPDHPSIVKVFDAGTLRDGSSYIVMERHGRNYLDRVRHGPLDVAEVLRVGVQIGAALETAHRAGVIHGDVKPANLVTSDVGLPMLTDFGVARPVPTSVGAPRRGTADGCALPIDGGMRSDDGRPGGLSVLWAAPEVLHGAPLGTTVDVYGLAATLYHLLAGRAPHHEPGGLNRLTDVARRAVAEPVRPIDRPDVPRELSRCLIESLSESPDRRAQSAAALGRAMQSIERVLGLDVTSLNLPVPAGPYPRRPSSASPPTKPRPTTVDEDGAPQGPVSVEQAHGPQPPPQAERPRVRRRAFVIGAAGVGIGVVLLVVPEIGSDPKEISPTAPVGVGVDDWVRSVSDLVGRVEGNDVLFEWNAPSARPGDRYVVEASIDGRFSRIRTAETSVRFPGVGDNEVCVEVVASRPGGPDSGRRAGCAP